MRGGRSSVNLRQLRELEALRGELLDLRAGDLRVGEADGLDDMDALVPGAVATGHLAVHLGDGAAEGSVSVLLVHVHIILARQVLQDNAVILDGGALALEDLGDRNDLTLALADLVLTLHLIPEPGAREDGVLGEHSDPEARRIGVVFRRRLSADDPVLPDLCFQLKYAPLQVEKVILTVFRMEGHELFTIVVLV